MEKNEVEKVLKDTIEYANDEIKKRKKKTLRIYIGIFLTIILLFSIYGAVFVHETPVSYQEGLLEIKIPEDEGMDIRIKMANYKRAKGILVKVDENNYDLYINITQTVFTKIVKDSDTENNLLRVGNGMIVDFQSQQLQGYIPNGKNAEVINHVYYSNDLTRNIETLDDNALLNYQDKILIWER